MIGLVTPMRGVTTSVHQVGDRLAALAPFRPARHGRRAGDPRARSRIHLLDPSSASRFTSQRKAHKEVVIFLHEWGHTLGLLHHEDPAVIMNPSYDRIRRRSAPSSRARSTWCSGAASSDRPRPIPEVAALESFLTDAPSDEGSDRDRAQLLDSDPPARARRAPARRSRAPSMPTAVTHAQIEQYNRAVASANAGRTEEAWADLAPVIARARESASRPRIRRSGARPRRSRSTWAR